MVLRAPRLGAIQQANVADAVAASLAHRPGCVATVNLQQLLAPSAGGDGPDLLLPAIAVGATTGKGAETQLLSPPAVAVAGEPSEQQAGSNQKEAMAEAEASGLSAYLSSWFGSPTKQPKLPPPAASQEAATAASSSSEQQPGARPAFAQGPQEPAGAHHDSSPHPGALQPAAAAAPAAASTVDVAAAAASAAELAGKLEERLESVLPSVGVVHLGLELASGQGAVLGWQQRLQVVAEPSESTQGLELAFAVARSSASSCGLSDGMQLPARMQLGSI